MDKKSMAFFTLAAYRKVNGLRPPQPLAVEAPYWSNGRLHGMTHLIKGDGALSSMGPYSKWEMRIGARANSAK